MINHNTDSTAETHKTTANTSEGKHHSHPLKNVMYPEMFFGIVAPIGVDTRSIVRLLGESLKSVGYASTHIKLTELMKEVPSTVTLVETPIEARYDSYIKYANEVRELYAVADEENGQNTALAMLAVSGIRTARKELCGKEDNAQERRAYILDQFKRPEEVHLIRRIYGRLFVLLSVHATAANRKKILKRKIKAGHGDRKKIDPGALAESLIARDNHEESVSHGQRVRDAFPMAEVVIDANSAKSTREGVDRLVKLLFGHNFTTPTRDEYGMYLAKAAALRSADLSRQVGAAIFSSSGEVITLGSNEVPKPGGGTYFEGDNPDHRDYAEGVDYNEEEKIAITKEVVEKLRDARVLNLPKSNHRPDTQEGDYDYLVNDNEGPKIKDARIMDILEFGRQIHAEMSALVDAARLGRAVAGGTLYCTTFPCHMCAKLILGAGVKRVVYIEPFPKSYAEDMYSHSIALEAPTSTDGPQILFQPFTGIAPFRYRDFFEKGRRKGKDGVAQEWKEGVPRPNLNFQYPMYLHFEVYIAAASVLILPVVDKIVSERKKTAASAKGTA
ncbi:MAG: anti-phage dCTP deaminase [Parvibaculaceae bacterium]